MAEARDYSGADLSAGLTAAFEREISAEDVQTFAALSGDHNPLHLDPAYAAQTNYGRPIVHGALQVALASAMAGMYLPGKRALVGSVRSRFPAPLYYPCKVNVRGEILSWLSGAQSGMLRVRVQEASTSALTAEIHIGFSLHEARGALRVAPVLRRSGSARPLIVLTGAGGGVGGKLAEILSERHDVLGLVRQVSLQDGPGAAPFASIACDLEKDDWESQASLALAGRPLYAVVHAAWPGAPRGGLLDQDLEIVRRQLEFGGPLTIRLARWLVAHASGAGRLVLIGSSAGTLRPELGMAAYSLGKGTLEQALRLLAPELAARGITANVILPSYMPLGINRAKPERAALIEAAKVPLGRLCSVEDVGGLVDYLLSPAAAFVTGQLLPLTGGRL